MKKLFILFALAFVNIYGALAQNNSLTMICEEDGKIFLEIDGKRQNTTAEKKVKVSGLNKASYKVKVLFENNTLPSCERTVEFSLGGNLVSNMDFYYGVGKDGNGGTRIRSSDMKKADGSANSGSVETYGYSSVSTVTFKASDTEKKQLQPVNTGSTGSSGNSDGYSVSTMTFKANDTTKKQLQPVSSGTTKSSGSVETYGYSSVSTVTFKASDTEKKQLQPVNSSTQSTAKTSSGSSSTSSSSSTARPSSGSPGTGNSGGCAAPMQASDFKASKKAVANSTFEDGKLEAAKKIADSNCLSVDQIKEINDKFTFEDTKLTFAKYCYSKCFDKNNYSKVSEKFTFESNKKELAEYIKGK